MTKEINSFEVLQDILSADRDDDLKTTLNKKYDLGRSISFGSLRPVGDIADRRKIMEINDVLHDIFQDPPQSNRTTNDKLCSIAKKNPEDLYNLDFFCDLLIEDIYKIMSSNDTPIKKINAVALLQEMPVSNPAIQIHRLHGTNEEKHFLQHIAALKDAWLKGNLGTEETHASIQASCDIFVH
jgi:hypothetical protein